MNHRRIAQTLGLVNVGLVTFVALLVMFPPPVATASNTIGFNDPPYTPPPTCDIHVMSTDPCALPPPQPPGPRDPYCLFPGQGKHLGFGNGFGRAGAKF